MEADMHKVFIKTDVYLKGSSKIQRPLTTRSAATVCTIFGGGRGFASGPQSRSNSVLSA